jgi:hypothetical protein
MKILVNIMEARTSDELQAKRKMQARGLHSESYFSFNLFCEQYFMNQFPQQLKREKFVFNFLWTLKHLENEHNLAEVFSMLIRGEYLLKDLHHLLMIKDFVKHHLHKKANCSYVDLGELGQMFEHSDSLVTLTRQIVLNYDDGFKPMYEAKFLQLKDEAEYITLFDFIGLATKAFHDLAREGIEPVLRKTYTSPRKTTSSMTARMPGDHLLKCYGMTGHIQDRSKKDKDDIKWYLWSDYTKKRSDAYEIDKKMVSDFFSVHLDERISNIKQASAKKLGQRTSSPLPYRNLTERTKRVIDDLDLDIGGRISTTGKKKPTFMGRQFGAEDDSKSTQLYRDPEMVVFYRFDRMPRDMGGGLRDKSVMQALREHEKTESRAIEIEKQLHGKRGASMNRSVQYLHECLELKLSEVVTE